MDKYGNFSGPSFITIGDQYDRKAEKGSRHGGNQFTTNPSKRGKAGSGVYFTKFNPLYEKEKFTDPGYHERQHIKQEKKRIIADSSFKPASPQKKMSGLGSYFGTIGGVYEHKSEYDVLKKGEVPKRASAQKPNILTNPAKKGTYGYTKTTIGAESKYEPDPYDAPREKEMQERKVNTSKIIGSGSFKAMSHSLDFFDTHKNVSASKIYTLDKPIPSRKEKSMPKKRVEVPFRPSSPPKKGGTFTKFPEYLTDPYEKKPKKDQKDASKPVWKGMTCGTLSGPTRSVFFNKSMNATM